MNPEYCSHCNPKDFVVFGFCLNCGKKCNAPLFDPKQAVESRICIQEWEEFPEYLSYEQLQGIKDRTINFIANTVKDEFHLPHTPL